MARLIDCDQYKMKYKGKDFTIQNMKVYWKDGTISDGKEAGIIHTTFVSKQAGNPLLKKNQIKGEINKKYVSQKKQN